MVYVLDINGAPLMSTERYGMVRRALKEGRARVAHRTPFTIQLLYETPCKTQPVVLGVDPGSKTIGLSATTNKKELFASEVELRNDITKLLKSRSEHRKNRRYRKTRYRAARFKNRKNKKKGWLSPSVRQKIATHLQAIRNVCKILPVTKIVVETANFDIQKIKNPEIEGVLYQLGEQYGFENVKAYVLWRDGYRCQCCATGKNAKQKSPILHVHHIESRKTGGDAPNNLVALCETCHKEYHAGTIKLPKSIKRGKKFNDAAFVNTMRKALFRKLKEEHADKEIAQTYGYITKAVRIEHGLPKTHAVDARCISGHPAAKPLSHIFYQKKVRSHNRKLHKGNPQKGGKRPANQSARVLFGFRLFDKVLYQGKECFIFGKRTSGKFDIRLLDGTKIKASVSYKNLRLLEKSRHLLVERQVVQQTIEERDAPPRRERRGFRVVN